MKSGLHRFQSNNIFIKCEINMMHPLLHEIISTVIQTGLLAAIPYGLFNPEIKWLC